VNKWDQKRRVMRRYDASSRTYDALYGDEQCAKFYRALKSLTVIPGSVILDAGCGSGLLFNRVVSEAKMVVGLDISRSLLLSATGKAKEHKNVHLVRADVDNMPFGDGVFSVVFAFTVLQNLPRPLETLQAISQVAKQGAVIVVTGLKKYFSSENFSNLLKRVEFSLVSFVDDDSLKCYVAVLRNGS
jgi:ubiquinone/menaquinone biosynthesis C-methylase UbiE